MITGLDTKNNKLICSECGSVIFKRYNRFSKVDKILCENCSKKSVKCDVCGVPSALTEDFDGLNVCPTCLINKDYCGCCGKKLNRNNRKRIKGVPVFFCFECIVKSNYKCFNCKRPYNDKKDLIQIDNNKLICKNCYSHHIYESQTSKIILDNVLKIIKSKFNIEFKNTLSVYLVSEIELKYLKKIKSKKLLISENKNGISFYDGDKPSIYLLNGLSIARFISTISRIYVFSYLCTFPNVGNDKSIELGFSKWLTGKLLYNLGYLAEYKRMIIEDALEDNNKGLIKIKAIEKYQGVDGVLNFALSRNKKKIIV